ncbi:uncharacterized protein SAPINGB_P003350 [Magnusiomyces paraingens]|uniref:Uncharacterized protein n=1 Tax=Magnusiomyces paraingens TaxID=2606893 RepID=A0A5E8BNW4_9ASCO|nr:uncharacterized protein SAPINGB_P003350 [Saprochaete ingens]VVT52993.1 unnamed protein product [Saprochaete ingens]
MLSSSAVFTLNLGVTMFGYGADATGLHSLTKFSSDAESQRNAFTNTPTVLYVRRDRSDRHRVANVFDSNGNKIYTFERRTMFSPIWSMYNADRLEVATVKVGIIHRSIDFHMKPEIKHREMALSLGYGGLSRMFYLNDGAPYEWSRASKYLERIVNPGGGSEEIRQRVAFVRLMRQLKFDFELLVDETEIDLEVALTTSYIAMNTLWGIGEQVETTGPTKVFPFISEKFYEDEEYIQSREVGMVYSYDSQDGDVDPVEIKKCGSSTVAAELEVERLCMDKAARTDESSQCEPGSTVNN